MSIKEDNIFYDCGEKFHVITKEIWEDVKTTKILNGIGFGGESIINIMKGMIEFSEQYEGFYVAVTKITMGKVKCYWMPILFFQTNSSLVRVRIERTKCGTCGWHGEIANPMLSDLYISVPNYFEEMRKKEQIEKINCPKCNSKLERYAIWVNQLI